MAIGDVSSSSTANPISATTATTRAANSGIQIAQNMDSFLKILTTQLQHQSPLDPMDSNQFTQQLVQFAGVEQQINMNQTLASVLTSLQQQQTNAALGYLGRNVSFDGSKSASADGQNVNWSFQPDDTSTYTLRVKDAGGKVMTETTANYNAGQPVTFNWSSGRPDGAPLGTDNYTLELLRGSGATATQVSVKGGGMVSSVDLANGQTFLRVNGQRIEASRVTTVAVAQ